MKRIVSIRLETEIEADSQAALDRLAAQLVAAAKLAVEADGDAVVSIASAVTRKRGQS